MILVSTGSHGGISVSTQRNSNLRPTPRPVGSRGDRGASESGEVASEFRGQLVMKDADLGGMAEFPYEGFVVDHGLEGNNMKVFMPSIEGAGTSIVRKRGEEREMETDPTRKKVEDYLPLNLGNESAESAAPVGRVSPNVEAAKINAIKLDAAKLASILGQIIPRLGPTSAGKNVDGAAYNDLACKGDCGDDGLALHGPTSKQSAVDIPTNPSFVFGAGQSGKESLGRKWKKAARVSKKYSFDFLSQASNIKEGRKRSKGISILEVGEAGATKKSREHEAQIEDTGEDSGDAVSEFINHQSRSWHLDKLEEVFVHGDYCIIRGLPIPNQDENDVLIWNLDPMGRFSVRSGYFVARNVLGRNDPSIMDRMPLWNNIWKSRVYPKVQFLIWRLVKGILPVRSILQQKGISLEDVCAVCGKDRETLEHMFFHCPLSKAVWELQCPWILVCLKDWADRDDVWQRIFHKASQLGSKERVFFTCWLLWFNRNRCVHKASCGVPRAVSMRVNSLIQQASRDDNSIDVHVDDRAAIRWKAPPLGVVKINMDAAFDSEANVVDGSSMGC
ncbi:hypothetical protein COLO4_05866 [Corchorus olitorius]|uniref:Reverse transcriptase zinc-binding domain-containing protein n=1 Tax=Corchorus olitorius TaxID=93759 RepID=A0A1R3KPM8_9ROSI|nr:hypothetical protein COLO4_05866 [Corchorus olitorius]